MRLLVTATAAAVVLVLTGPTAAQASCATDPQPSRDRFVGTVVEVESDGRLAYVVLDDGTRVEVHGSSSLGVGSATSVDRQYAVGGRYEFHPTNARSPYQDNICTATRQLAGPTSAAPGQAHDPLPGWLPVDEPAGPVGYAALAGGSVAVLTALAALVAAATMIVRRFRP
jgi:hypothetical protein